MKLRRSQYGMSVFNLMYVLITLAIFGYIGLKLMPIYLESFKIKRAVGTVAASPNATQKSPRMLVDDIIKRLDIDSVNRITKANWQDYLQIERKKKTGLLIAANYSAEVPLFLNVAVVAKQSYVGKSSP